jgi:hypothetical protein
MYTGGGVYEFRMARRADLNALGDITGATWAPAFQPAYVIGVAAINDNALVGAGEIRFDKRPTFGSDAGRGNGDAGILILAASLPAGSVQYKFITPVKVSPGQEIVAELTDVGGAGDLADVVLLLSPSPEVPANIAAMVASA